MRLNLMELEGEIEKSMMITGGDFNTPRLVTDILSRQKINKHIVFLSSAINQFDLLELVNTPPNTSRRHVLFMLTWNINILGYKTHLNIKNK